MSDVDVDDVGLLERARRGDAEAFSGLYVRYQRGIYRYAVHMCGRDAGDDIVQETFLAVLRQTGRFDPSRGSHVGSYLLGIARHLVLKRLGARVDAAFDDGAGEDAIPAGGVDEESVLDRLTRAELVDAVRAAVRSLPPVFREAVVLCELQELDYAAAAEVLQCPIGTVRSRLSRGRALLAARLRTEQPVVGMRKA
jgi:RNA polymerase sigma-70 factor, ECF subfamily